MTDKIITKEKCQKCGKIEELAKTRLPVNLSKLSEQRTLLPLGGR